jgi:DNA-binding transcriptional regulator GbsR (MarR family)
MNLLNEGFSELVPSRRNVPVRRPHATAPAPAAGTTGPGAEPAGAESEKAERDEEAVGRFIERFASILFESGVPRMPARVFVALLTADADRLTAADLGAILKVSPAAVSGAVRYLLQVGLVSGAGEPGSRRLSYGVPPDVWEQLLSMGNQRMTRWTAVLRDGVDVLGGDSPAGERIVESVRYFDFIAAELPRVLARWHEHKASPDRPGEAGADGRG